MAQNEIFGKTSDDALIRTSESSIIYASSGDDSVVGSNHFDQIFGGYSPWREEGLVPGYQGAYMHDMGDDDTINARGGNDVIYVGSGRDNIDGGDGIDQLNFYLAGFGEFYEIERVNADLQRFVPHSGRLTEVMVDLAAGSYTGVYRDEDNKAVANNSGSIKSIEAVLGSLGDDTIRGSKNNDQFKPIRGNDVVDGRDGFDIISYNDAGTLGIVVDVGAGKVTDSFGHTDKVTNIEHFIGTGHADTFKGSSGAQVFTGGNSDDTFNGGGGTDLVDYHLEQGTKALLILLKNGTGRDMYGSSDTFDSIENIRGSTLGDVISGNKIANEFWGDLGDDNVDGGDNNDTVHGGAGDDTVLGGAGDDSVMGDDGNDTVKGAAGVDTLYGGKGSDRLDGQKGNDVLYGEAGDDTLLDAEVFDPTAFIRGEASNSLYGGLGEDTIKGAGMLFGDENKDYLYGIGTLNGGVGNDVLTAQDLDITNTPIGATLIGGAGNDTLVDKFDRENFHFAVADYSYASHALAISLAKGKVTVDGGDVDTLVGINGLQGTGFDDTLSGTQAYDRIFGGNGDDVIKGGDDHDELHGGDGNDTLFGGDGDDGLLGEKGKDEIHTGGGGGLDPSGVSGGSGKDTIYVEGGGAEDAHASISGGAGNDTIIASGGYAELYGDGGTDRFVLKDGKMFTRIWDFHHGEKIDMSAYNIASYAELKGMMLDSVLGYYMGFIFEDGAHIEIIGFHREDMTKADFIL